MKNPFIIPELEEYKSKLKDIFKTYSQEELLIRYRESLTKSTKLERVVLFEILNEEVKDISIKKKVNLYHKIDFLSSVEEIRKDKFGENVLKKILSKLPFDEEYAKKMIECMVETSNLYNDNLITSKDLYVIEQVIDKISIPSLEISDKIELERIYSKFKEFAIDVYLKND